MTDDEYIEVKTLFKTNENNLSTEEASLLLEQTEENLNKMYQISSIKDTNYGKLIHIGYSKLRPVLLLKEFKFFENDCKIMTYILNDIDIKNATDKDIKNPEFKIIGLTIHKHNIIKGVITIEYKMHNLDMADITVGKTMPGIFTGYLKTIEKKILLYEFDKYPGNGNMIEKLIKLMTHDEIINIL